MRFKSFFVACGFVLGCSSGTNTHAPFLSLGCDTPPCPVDRPSGTAQPGGNADGGITAVGTGNLTGEVDVFTDPTFVNGTPFTGEGSIVVRGTNDVAGTLSGASFSVENTDVGGTLWVGVESVPAGDFLPTVTGVVGTATSVEVAFVRSSIMEGIVALLPAPATQLTPTQMLAGSAQVVVRFVDAASGAPLPGIEITQPAGGGVLYDTSSSYSNSFGATGARGIAIIVNSAAGGAFPGLRTTFSYRLAAVADASADVSFASDVTPDGVTVQTVSVP